MVPLSREGAEVIKRKVEINTQNYIEYVIRLFFYAFDKNDSAVIKINYSFVSAKNQMIFPERKYPNLQIFHPISF